MQTKLTLIAFLVAIVLIVGSLSVFTVDQREQAIVLQLGQPVGEIRRPGLHFKIPLVQEVRRFDSRILPVDPPAEQVVISSGSSSYRSLRPKPETTESEEAGAQEAVGAIENVSGEPIIVDTFARYRIVNPLQFMKTLQTVDNANGRIENILRDSTRAVLGKTTLRNLLSSERTKVMTDIRERVNQKTKNDEFGIEIVDVRIVRADLTDELRTSTVRRMISELKERATETRARGEERALEIRSTAEKERTILLAEAKRDAEILRGQGDEEAIGIYADAFNRDKDFYSFLRSMEAYKTTLSDPDTRLLLSPESEFFQYFKEVR